MKAYEHMFPAWMKADPVLFIGIFLAGGVFLPYAESSAIHMIGFMILSFVTLWGSFSLADETQDDPVYFRQMIIGLLASSAVMTIVAAGRWLLVSLDVSVAVQDIWRNFTMALALVGVYYAIRAGMVLFFKHRTM